MKRPVNIFVACGSGIATSAIACDTVREICEKAGIPINLSKGALSEVESRAASMDLILTTSKFHGQCPTPVLSITAFITGVGEEAAAEQLIEQLRRIEAAL